MTRLPDHPSTVVRGSNALILSFELAYSCRRTFPPLKRLIREITMTPEDLAYLHRIWCLLSVEKFSEGIGSAQDLC